MILKRPHIILPGEYEFERFRGLASLRHPEFMPMPPPTFGKGGDAVAPMPSYVSKGTRTTGTTSVATNFPAGWAAGQLAILCVAAGNVGLAVTINTPAGWTAASSQVTNGNAINLMVFYRLLQGGDTDPTVSITSAIGSAAIILTYADATVVDAVQTGTAASSTTQAFLTTTTLAANSMLIQAMAGGNGTPRTVTPPAGSTEREDGSSTSQNQLYVAERAQAAVGASTGGNSTWSASTATAKILLAIHG